MAKRKTLKQGKKLAGAKSPKPLVAYSIGPPQRGETLAAVRPGPNAISGQAEHCPGTVN